MTSTHKKTIHPPHTVAGKEGTDEETKEKDMKNNADSNNTNQYADEIRDELNAMIKGLKAAVTRSPLPHIPVTVMFHGKRTTALQSTPHTNKDFMIDAIQKIAKIEDAHMITMSCLGWTTPWGTDKDGHATSPKSHHAREHMLLVSGISRRHPWSISIMCPLTEKDGKILSIGEPMEATNSASMWLDHVFTANA